MAGTPAGALILIDLQQGFDHPGWGGRNNPDAERRASDLLAHWRRYGAPVIHVRHNSDVGISPLRRGLPGFEFKPEVAPIPGEIEIMKSANSAFIGTDLEALLRSKDIARLTLCGLTTPHCVSTTARMAGNLGFETLVVADACAAVARNLNTDWTADPSHWVDGGPEASHFFALSHLHGEFATVLSSDALLGR